MNNGINNNQQKIAVNATEIINKYRKLEDRLNFCLEKNWFHPKEIGYDANYFLSVIKGDKKYLPNNFTINYNIGYFRTGEKLDKKYLIEKMKNNNTYALYTPDVCDPMKFSKLFLLKLIAFIDPNLFREIYATNKKQRAERNYNKWGDFKIDINRDLAKDVKEFTSISNTNNNRGGFRMTKNHQQTNLFYQYKGKIKNNLNNREINQNVQNKINELNVMNNNIINENQKLKNEIQELRNKVMIQNDNNVDKEIVMKDVGELNNLNNKEINEKFYNSGKPKAIKIEEGNKKLNIIDIKLHKKK